MKGKMTRERNFSQVKFINTELQDVGLSYRCIDRAKVCKAHAVLQGLCAKFESMR